uniref:ergothioneine biosynthesis protein EgtB n=1 Tax=Calothrix sp. PCC 6303 TaxID=1170562 RepID=UPI0005A0DF85|nr:ergothioneine biosynthesis protein EgtB [Calothrix sp. PCC 6303]
MRYNFVKALQECRSQTLELLTQVNEESFCCQVHCDFSPVGWHFGHIAYAESLWLLEGCADENSLFPQYRRLFAADGLPKNQRIKLPSIENTRFYLDAVRERVLDCLEVADVEANARLWWFILQHECQHCETVAFILQLMQRNFQQLESKQFLIGCKLAEEVQFHASIADEMIKIPSGQFVMGSDSIDALDNEKPSHSLYLDSYLIDKYPVTCEQYNLFMAAGGYENPLWWSGTGWEWLQSAKVKAPLYWDAQLVDKNHPVCGVSWYEAEAYAKFLGKRLPTEAEWEKASSWDAEFNCSRIYPWGKTEPMEDFCNCNAAISQTTPIDTYHSGKSPYGMYDALGNVWEWTDSWFTAYPGFKYYPYKGYSQVYFDGQHRVLKGGSWATRSFTLRASFRNWYHPHVRQIFAGFRCAK